MATAAQDSFYARLVRRITSWRRGISRLTALLMLTAAVVLMVALCAALDVRFILAKTVREALLPALLTGAVLFLWHRWRKSRIRNTHRDTVLRMERSQPSTGQLLRTAWETVHKKRNRSPSPEAAAEEEENPGPGFEAELIRKSQVTAQIHSWSHLLPKRGILIWLLTAAACLAAVFQLARQWPDFQLGLRRVLSPATAPTYTQAVWTSSPDHFDDRHPPRLAVSISGRQAAPLLYLREAGAREWQAQKLTALPDGRSHDVILTGKMTSLEAYVQAGDGVTQTLLLNYRPTPRLLDTAVTVKMPDYTGRAPDLRKGGDVNAVEGSELAWDFTFNTPPPKAEVQITSPTEVPMTIPVRVEGNIVKASWPLPLGKFGGVLTVYDSEGAAVDSWKYDITGVRDELPKVEIPEPSKDLEATSITELPVRIRARDDFGVAELGLILEAAGKTFWTLEKVIEARDTTDLTEMTRAMLEAVPLDVRDNVRVYAYALDHKPRGGPRGVSPLRSIDIRQFKMRSIYLGKAKGPRIDAKEVTKINALITAQRAVVSDTHLLKEPARTETEAAMAAPCQPVAQKEMAVIEKTAVVHQEWESEPAVPQDDVVLLATAQQQMSETLPLFARGSVDKAFVSADRALNSLLQIRKHFLTLIMESDNPNKSDDAPKMTNPQDLVKEALRLAGEEKAVREQIAPDSANLKPAERPQADLAVSRRQQEVALSDAGELYASLMAYEKKNEGMLGLMQDAETAMKQADERIHTEQHTTAVPSLTAAERHLTDLADFIKAMDAGQLPETLQQMAAKAEQDAKKAAQGQAKADGAPKPGETPGGKPAPDGKPGSGGSPSETAQTDSGKAVGEESVKTEAEKKAAEDAKAALAEAARNAALADEILKALAAQALAAGEAPAEGGGEGEGKGKAGGAEELSREDLEGLRERAGTEALAKDLKKLAAAKAGKAGKPDETEKPGGTGKEGGDGKEGQGDQGKNGQETAAGTSPDSGQTGPGSGSGQGPGGGTETGMSGRLSEMAGQLRAEARRLQSSRLARLAALRAQAKAMMDKLAREQKDRLTKEDKELQAQLLAQGIPPGTRVRINGKTITLGNPAGENSVASNPYGKSQPGEGKKPGEEGKPGGGEKPGEGENGGNNPASGGPATQRFVADARKLNDEPITTWTKQLETEVPDLVIPALTGIIQRLDTLVAELPPSGGEEKALVNRIPENSRREVEDYFKNLSDDLDDE
ncbi:MAG: hypothetical protein V4726_23735 [Verrucomicrobiota bacterium]